MYLYMNIIPEELFLQVYGKLKKISYAYETMRGINSVRSLQGTEKLIANQ